jgi:large subunit ribosomal protein L9
MRVILMQRVERLGEPGQQVEVADGYARNFLLPKRLAVAATPGNLTSLGKLTAQTKNREDRLRLEAKVLAEKLATVQIVLRRRASEEPVPSASGMLPAPGGPAPGEPSSPGEGPPAPPAGRLFGSVSSQDLSQALASRGLSLDKKKILLPEPIKTLGVHRVPVRLHADVTAELTVNVEREA